MSRVMLMIAVVVISPTLFAQALPASTPATTQRARHEVIVPPGFQKVTIAGHTVLAEPIDLVWIKDKLTSFTPTTRPTTMPSDLVESLKSVRPKIEQAMAADLGIADQKATAELFDEILLPNLQRVADLKVPLIYLVTTNEKLKELMKNGWRDPRLHYNRVADEVQFASSLDLNLDRELDDYLVPAIYPPNMPPAQRKEHLNAIVNKTEAGLASALSVKAQSFVHTATMTFIGRQIFGPLHLQPSQEWLAMGVSSTFAGKYMGMVNHMEFKDIMSRMTREHPQNPIAMRTIDLAHPTSPQDLRPEALPFYIDAMGKKAMIVTMKILDQGGPGAIKKIIAAVNEKHPKDGDELVKLIKDATGVDVSEDVKAKS